MRTSRSNMRRLRAGLIGSISAWLPSRRSTAHHIGARSTTLSGQVRSTERTRDPGSTSSAKRAVPADRHRRAALGVPGRLAVVRRRPTGVVMVRADVKASGESGGGSRECGHDDCSGSCRWTQTGASRTPATGSRSGSDPVAAAEKEHPLHVRHCTPQGRPAGQNPRWIGSACGADRVDHPSQLIGRLLGVQMVEHIVRRTGVDHGEVRAVDARAPRTAAPCRARRAGR